MVASKPDRALSSITVRVQCTIASGPNMPDDSPMNLRRWAERFSRGIVLRRRLPDEFRNLPICVSPEAGLRTLRNQGRVNSEDWLQHSELGYNYRLSEMNCALGIGQLKRIEAILSKREEIARKYTDRLMENDNLRLPTLVVPRRRISWFVYVVRLSQSWSQVHRDWIVKEMNRRGIVCGGILRQFICNRRINLRLFGGPISPSPRIRLLALWHYRFSIDCKTNKSKKFVRYAS
jgi:hypothetical protein